MSSHPKKILKTSNITNFVHFPHKVQASKWTSPTSPNVLHTALLKWKMNPQAHPQSAHLPPKFHPSSHKMVPTPSSIAHHLHPPQKKQPVSSDFPPNGGLSNGQVPKVMFPPRRSLGTSVLRRSFSERGPRPDSGISFTTPNGLHNAKVSAKAMDRALSNKLRTPDPMLVQKEVEVEVGRDGGWSG